MLVESKARSPSALRVLLVDDDEVDRQAVQRQLNSVQGPFEVVESADGEGALARLCAEPFDCVLTDVRLPPRDGRWLIREARAAGVDVPFVVLTGHGDEETAVEMMKAGAADYLSKGAATPERLSQAVRHAVRVALAEREAARAVQALQESEQRFRLALEAAALGAWEFDVDTDVLRGDARAMALFSCKPEMEVSGDGLQRCIHPDDRERLGSPAMWVANASEKGMFEEEYRVVPADRPFRWIRITGRVIFEDRRPSRLVGTVQDVTSRREAKERARREAEFEQHLVGIVSHDLRNPISAMMMSASVLLKREDTHAHAAKVLSRILSSGERAARLIRDLLDFTQARIGGGIPIHRERANLHELMRRQVEEVELNEPDRRVELQVRGTAEGLWDPDRLAQVVQNLLSNALKYSPPDTPVRLSVSGDAREVVVEVHNRGVPIPSVILPVMFEPFRRGTMSDHGTRSVGLGLYIVRHLVEAHGGDVTVQSSESEGTTFRLRLPRWVGAEESAAPDGGSRPLL